MTGDATPCDSDICVVGGGPAGLAAALAVAARGWRVLVLGQNLGQNLGQDLVADHQAPSKDTRTTAILGDGIPFLRNLGVWEALQPISASVSGIRIVDDRGGWLAAPEVVFDAREMGRDTFGYNVPNGPLRVALLARAAAHPAIRLMSTAAVTTVMPGVSDVRLTTAEQGVYRCKLVIAADGRASVAREAAGIAVRRWSYPQVAVATSFSHARPHHGISTELHRRRGPLTTVPLPDDAVGPRSSLVWVSTADEATRLMALDARAFAAELGDQLQGLLGAVSGIGLRATFPIAGLMAVAAGRGRVVLAGEAAHVLPPIGAQGLNLGLRDGAAIADAVGAAREGSDPGAAPVVAAYVRARAGDLVSREIGVDLLNRSLLTDFGPVQALRGLGLHALANSRTLRRTVMQLGLSAPGPVPTLMRPLAKPA